MEFLPILLLITLISAASAKTCGQQAVQRCLGSLRNTTVLYNEIEHLTRSAEKPAAAAAAPSSGESSEDDSAEEDEFEPMTMKSVSYVTVAVPEDESVCSDFAAVDKCIMGGMVQCEDVTRASYDGIHEAYTYLCSGDGKNLYPDYQQCVTTKDLVGHEHLCDVNITSVYEYMDKELTFSIHNYDRNSSAEDCHKYQLMQEILGCHGKAVNETCGAAATTFWQTFMDKKLVRFTLLDQCDYVNGSVVLRPGSYEVCEDGSDIYLKTDACNSHFDCLDHSDEKNCTGQEEDFTELTTRNMIVLICIGVSMLVLGIGTICIVKHKENKEFSAKLAQRLRNAGPSSGIRHQRMEDMEEIMDDIA